MRLKRFSIYQQGVGGLWFWQLTDHEEAVICSSNTGKSTAQECVDDIRHLATPFRYADFTIQEAK